MNSLVPKILVTLCCFIFSLGIIAQSNDSIWSIIFQENEHSPITKLTENKQLADSILTSEYFKYVNQGFLDIRFDTVITQQFIYVQIEKGEVYCIGENLFEGNLDLTNIVRRRLSENGDKLDTYKIENNARAILDYLQNIGYPFATIAPIDIQKNTATECIDIRWKIDKGPLISIDSLVIRSNDKIPIQYIINYCDIDAEDVYDESKLRALQLKLQEIPFLKILRAPEVLFHENKATVYIFCERKKSNYFNGIIGVRPDEKTDKVNITGEIEIKLQNALNKGEDINLNWKRLQPQTQDLSINTRIPFIFSLPIGLDGLLKIYRRDTSFSSTRANAGISIPFGGSDFVKVFIEKNTSNRLSNLTALALKDVNSTIYGISSLREKLDYKFNPTKGYSLQVEAGAGTRKILADIQDNSSAEQNPIYRAETAINVYFPLFKKQSIHLGLNGSTLITDNIYSNELSRIGGLRTIRGIDEESIFASSYAVSTIEYRWIPELNTALYVFIDQAWYEQKAIDSFVSDIPRGFGVGANFETKAGIFTFNYALGQQFDNPILIRNAKISFGFKNIF
jgi:outer membrane protein assembly factor BamA